MPKFKRKILYNKDNILILRTLSVFRTYYGDYSIKKFKYFIQRLKKRKLDFISKCLTLFESRLDILLYRLNYFKNPREARNFVRNKNVIINNNIKKELNYQLYINDIIEIKKK
jgi:ribosomal protein S4